MRRFRRRIRPGRCGGSFVSKAELAGIELPILLVKLSETFVIFRTRGTMICHKNSAERICKNVTKAVARYGQNEYPRLSASPQVFRLSSARASGTGACCAW